MSDETVTQVEAQDAAVEAADTKAVETGTDAVVNNGGQDVAVDAGATIPEAVAADKPLPEAKNPVEPDEPPAMQSGNAMHLVMGLGKVVEIQGRGLLINDRFAAGLGIKVVDGVATIIGI